MVLGWLSGARDQSLQDLIARKRYDKAIKVIRAELEKHRNDRRLRLRLGDVLLLAGRRQEGLDVLRRVSDELALAGQIGQAIAVLKKIEVVEPGLEDVEDRLAYLVERRKRPDFDPWQRSGLAADIEAEPGDEIGFEPSSREPEPMREPAPPPTPDVEAAPSAPAQSVEAEASSLSEDDFHGELLALVETALQPAASRGASPPAPPADPGDGERTLDVPLFKSLSREELAALIRGLRLLTFEAGEIVVSEGERGGSLFLVTSGAVRAYVRNAAQKQVQVRQLGEGDFFGEISVLTGRPRSATVTAAARCELLELDKATLDRISGTHPHVRQVMEDFYEQRAQNTLETMIRTMGLSEGPPGGPR
jgi:hypothetical protein